MKRGMQRRQDAFSGCHPAVQFLFFALVLGFAMCLTHPAVLLAALLGGFCYGWVLYGKNMLRGTLLGVLPVLLVTALVNPAFNHQGATILTYLPSGNPLTLESILSGVGGGLLMAAVLVWFACCTRVMTSDKFVYLFGRVIPALSLVLSMTLRFVPRFRNQLKTVVQAQKSLGRDPSSGSPLQRLRRGCAVLSILITWALESAVDTADSMRSRGYGLPGRTAFSIYRWGRRDKRLTGWCIACGIYLLLGWWSGGLAWQYYPTLRGAPLTPGSVSIPLVYLALCLTPVILQRREERLWNSFQSGH